jgi:SpoVK/Ycf46/Vps4 family AAA+-type ATPase
MTATMVSGGALQNGASEAARLFSEFRRIDVLIQQQVQRTRQQHQPEEQFQGLVISEREVDELLSRPPGSNPFAHPDNAAARDKPETSAGADDSRLSRLARLFGLTAFDLDCLLIALAPELDARYERLYGYLQDDITKRWPSVDLLLNLLCPSWETKMAARERFQSAAPLVRYRLIDLFEEPSHPHPTALGKHVKSDERVTSFLLGSDEPDARLQPYLKSVDSKVEIASLVVPRELRSRIAQLAHHRRQSDAVVFLRGGHGSGKKALAAALCRELDVRLLAIDLRHMAACSESEWRSLIALAMREATLQPAALYLSGFDALVCDEKEFFRTSLLRELDTRAGWSFLAAENPWRPAGELTRPLLIHIDVPRSLHSERVQIWERSLAKTDGLDFTELASKFRFTPGQIREASTTARNLAYRRDPAKGTVEPADVYEACRLHSNRKLSDLAKRIEPHYAWGDIILPADRVMQLREICNCVKYRGVVYEEWGFDRKLSLGKGLHILFSGPPGTGKTMAAEIIAKELELDLYKIDLSSMVSKYIGETEKNLARVFQEAETSNAILFFDEADALFGKRSEVRDSHDRYANIEVGYLLQRMEEYEGVVILATNFRRNMDEAFVRRIHFTVEFPFPNEADRRQIWETIWPKETPRKPDLDLEYISRRFEIAGGNIRNIALGAAFLAADNGGAVNMQHLLHATRREYQKMGKVVGHGEFDGVTESSLIDQGAGQA